MQKAGCNLDRASTKKKIVTANGTIDVPIVTVPWFNCLGIKRKNYLVAGLDLPASSFVDGLLGIEFLREVGAIIDVAKAEIKVENQNQ
ncbi:hypothetical protein [Myxosarcina sp. GI1]|uniref:hypothetical protein n=1 Tax=Myxosarcina sp. GI1 TaxID=1541065 RepID=UPI00068DD097|nr:hypothetical protein [Myxosarcina sp. GI1]